MAESPSVEGATPITLSLGNRDVTGINFTLDIGGSVSGYVFETDGTTPVSFDPVNAVWVDISTTNGQRSFSSPPVGSDGSYRVTGLPPGDYIAQARGGDYAVEFYDEAGNNGSDATVIHVPPSAEVTGINFTLDPGGTVSGHVYSASTGLPIRVTIGVDGTWIGRCSFADGSYTVYNVPLNVPLKITAGGGPSCDENPQRYVSEWWQEASNAGDATPITLTLGDRDATGIDFTLEPAGSVSGHVYESDGVTLTSGNVWLTLELVSGGGWMNTGVNPDGSYTFQGVTAGTYRIRAEGDNYAMEFYHEAGAMGDNADPVVVVNGVDTPNIDFTLDPGGTISGTVYAADGVTPLANQVVNVLGAWVGTCSDANGHYTLRGLPLNVPLKPNTSGDNWCGGAQNYREEWWQESVNEAGATPIILTTATPDVSGIDFTLEPGGSISGHVYASDGVTPLANVNVDTDFFGYGFGACTAADGSFTISRLPLNTNFKISAGGNIGCGNPGSYVREFWQETPDWNLAAMLSLPDGSPNLSGIDFTLELGGSISGHVYKTDGTTPVTGNVWIDANNYATGLYSSGAQVNPDGSYIIYGVPVGDQRVASRGDGYAVEFYNEKGTIGDNADPVVVVAGANTPNIDFTLDPGGMISGTVYEADGVTPVANMRVDSDNAWVGTCTDVSGHYTLYNLPLNTPVTVNAGGDNWCGGGSNHLQEWWQNASTLDDATPITLTNGSPAASGIDFTLELGGSISGVVMAEEDGSPLSGIWLCAFDYSALAFNETPPWHCTQTNPDGTYTITGIPPADQRVWIFPEDRLRLFYDDSATFAGATAVSVSGGSTVGGIDFSLPLAGIITGHIYDENGQPLVGVTISLADGSYPECSQGDGSYRIFVPAGSHTVKAEAGMCGNNVDFPTQYYNAVSQVGAVTPITINVGETVSGINFARQNVAPSGTNLVTNGDFETGQTTGRSTDRPTTGRWADCSSSSTATTPLPAASSSRPPSPCPLDAPVEVTVELGNTGGFDKQVLIRLSEGDDSNPGRVRVHRRQSHAAAALAVRAVSAPAGRT
ncbi:MAG: hypothetical protein U0703_24950 [Anaerolineae bacterium]